MPSAMGVLRSWLLPILLTAFSWAVLLLGGVPFPTATLAVIVLVVQVLTGAIWWAWIRRATPTTFVELIGMGIALGTLGAMLGAQFTVLLGLGGWGWLLPSIGALIVVAFGSVGRIRLTRLAPMGIWLWGAVGSSVLVGLVAIYPNLRRTPLMDGYVVGGSYHGDLVFLEGISQSLARFGPSENMLLWGEAIKYHWFSYAWSGSLTEIVGADAFVVLTRVFPLVVLIGAACLAAAWAARLSPIVWVPAIASLLVVVGSYVGATQGVLLTYDSPSAGFSALMMLAFSLAMTEYLYFRVGREVLIVIAVLAAGTLGAKVSQAAVLVAGIVLLVAASFWYARSLRARVWAVALVSAAAMGITYLAILAGIAISDSNVQVGGLEAHASTFQGLDPFTGTLGVTLGTTALVLAILPRWIGCLWLLRGRVSRFAPETVYGLGVGLAGIGTLFILRSGTNAAWFALASSSVLAVLSAVGLGRALSAVEWLRPSHSGIPRWRDPVVQSMALAIVISAVVFLTLALAEVTGAPVLWRGPVFAWLLALGFAVLLMRSHALHGSRWLRWAAMVTSILIFSSMLSRFGGPLIWEAAQDRATPIVQRFVLLLDPAAEFPSAASAPTPATVTAGPPRSASAAIRAEDTRGENDGVARTTTIIQWSPELNAGATWLAAHATPTDLVAMDQPRYQPFLPIMSGLGMYLAGVPYTAGYTTKAGAEQIPLREDVVTEFLAQPSDLSAALLWQAGVRWLWVQDRSFDQVTGSGGFAEVMFTNTEVSVLHLSDPGASSS